MPTYIKRARVRPRHVLGLRKSIFRTLARDEELRFFLRMSKQSLRTTARELDELIRPA